MGPRQNVSPHDISSGDLVETLEGYASDKSLKVKITSVGPVVTSRQTAHPLNDINSNTFPEWTSEVQRKAMLEH